jgi:copper chaperone CopZ
MNVKSITFFVLVAFAPSVVIAEDITVTVKGMVCAFCAQGIKKAFGAIEGVERVEPDLDKKLIVVSTKADTTLRDADVTKVVNDAGYDVVKIERK